jgi:phosphatidylglycerophosphatase C
MGTLPPSRQTAIANRPIVGFDFDGTLTVRDSFNAFLLWNAGPAQAILCVARLAPAVLRYLFDRDRARLKSAALRVFLRGKSLAWAQGRAETFAKRARLLRPDALTCWENWRARGAQLVIVTASPDFIVAPFARRLGASLLIATRVDTDDRERLTGALLGRNCRGAEKVARLREVFGPDVRLEAAYGDTSGDREMLALAQSAGLKVFKGRP